MQHFAEFALRALGMFAGITPERVDCLTDKGNALQDWSEQENMLIRENKKHKFWKRPLDK